MKLCNHKFLFFSLFVVVVVAAAACSKTQTLALNTDSEGVALRGFDAVAYFAVACVVAYVFSSHHGIYSAQLLGDQKLPGSWLGRERS